MIKSFRNEETRRIWAGETVTSLPPDMQRRAQEKLQILHAAREVNDLRIPPSNRLETLHGNRRGQWSIRINRQWRICFRWEDGDAYEVEITDYH